MQTDIFEVDPLSDNRKLYVRALKRWRRVLWWGFPRKPFTAWGRMP